MKRKPSGMQASEWTPPPEMLRIAQKRTIDIVGQWCARLRWGTATVQHLAESAYMQGINDSIESLTRTEALQRLLDSDKPQPRNLPA